MVAESVYNGYPVRIVLFDNRTEYRGVLGCASVGKVAGEKKRVNVVQAVYQIERGTEFFVLLGARCSALVHIGHCGKGKYDAVFVECYRRGKLFAGIAGGKRESKQRSK